MNIKNVKSQCAPSPSGDWWRKREESTWPEEYVFSRAYEGMAIIGVILITNSIVVVLQMHQ